ncbi:hypothetical protein CRG98_043071 [Punica granatum]|uniref:UDP-glucose iridoid glucosyltransferase-like n=1 Tax=Punica granatum TaxID=22663 RepID=A0A2I0HXV4_PUNGR|nr:hypothetical protein CRG98_043071 [Punica granatum]
MELLRQHCVPVLAVGQLHKIPPPISSSLFKEDDSCIKWLDKQAKNSVFYVIRPSSVRGSEWTELLPKGFIEIVGERGLIIKWAPQKEVLAQQSIRGFWSHCGWNATLESVPEGIPMICNPCFADQRVNARYLWLVWNNGQWNQNNE